MPSTELTIKENLTLLAKEVLRSSGLQPDFPESIQKELNSLQHSRY